MFTWADHAFVIRSRIGRLVMLAHPRLSSLLDASLIAALAIGSLVAVFVIEWAPREQYSSVAVVFPPWVGNADAALRIAAAGASLIRNGGFPFVMIVRPQTADFTRAVLREGALMVLDAGAFRGCLGVRRGP